MHVLRLALGGMIAASIVTGEMPAQAAPLPSVAQVYDAYAKAIGGRDAWAKVSERADIGTANITFANLTGTYARYNSAPNKFRFTIEMSVGNVDQGSDGTVVWGSQPGSGPAPIAGEDAAYILESAVTGDSFLDPTHFASATVAARETFDGVDCYKVSIHTKSNRNRADYFEVATGLRRGQVLESANGPQMSVFREYKSFDGKKVATTIVQSNGQGDVLIAVTKVTFTPNDPALFILPPGIGK